MTSRPLFAVLPIVLALGGCVPSRPLADGELDGLWTLTENPIPHSPYKQPAFGQAKLPAHWVIRQRPGVIGSTVSIVRAFDHMKAGRQQVEFSISPAHTRALLDLLDQAQTALAGLAKLAQAGAGSDQRVWSQQLARLLVLTERIARMVSPTDESSRQDEPAALAAWPLLQVLAAYLNESFQGTLLEDLGPQDIDRLRTVLAQVVLKLGFETAGKQLPLDLRQAAATQMRQADSFEALEARLAEMLLDRIRKAPPTAREGQVAKIIRLVNSWAPRGVEVLQSLIAQWGKMDKLELEFRHLGDQPIVAVTISVLDGKEVRVGDVMTAQPTMVFRGTSRIVVIPAAPGAGETVVMFEPVNGGATELRFEGLIYGLVRLLAIPLADARLREVRVLAQEGARGCRLVNVAVITEAKADKADPRRMMVYQEDRRNRLVRRPFSIDTVQERRTRSFSYLTAKRIYHYERAQVASAAEAMLPAGAPTRP